MKTTNRYPLEVREQAVRLLTEQLGKTDLDQYGQTIVMEKPYQFPPTRPVLAGEEATRRKPS
jgi:hypothetical protein